MNDLTPPPERDLPAHTRHRGRLLAAVRTDHGPRFSGRLVVPLMAAAASVVILGAGAFAVQHFRAPAGTPPAVLGSTPTAPATAPDRTPAPSTTTAPPSPTRDPGRDPLPGATGKPDVTFSDETPLPAPEHQRLSGAELDKYAAKCKSDGPPGRPLIGMRIAGVPKSDYEAHIWVVVQSGSTKLQCSFTGVGEDFGLNNASAFGSEDAKDIPYLYDVADLKGQGFGLYTRPVARIVVQRAEGERPQEAVMADGYWFFVDDQGTSPEVRAYDEDGKLLFDSTKVPDEDSFKCIADPTGTRVINGEPGDKPSDCNRTYFWKP